MKILAEYLLVKMELLVIKMELTDTTVFVLLDILGLHVIMVIFCASYIVSENH